MITKMLRLLKKIFWKLFVGIRFVFVNFYKQYIIFPIGVLYCILKFREKDTAYVIVCDHIGDTLFSLGYLRAFRDKYDIKKIAFVTTAHLMQLADMYTDDVDYKIAISECYLHLILKGEQTPIGVRLYRRIKKIVIVEPANHVVTGFNFIGRFPNVYLIDLIRYGIFGLDLSDSYVLPMINEDTCKEEQSKESNDNYIKVVLTPQAQVIEKIPEEYFVILAERLKKCGYKVYTNAENSNDKVIMGTERFCYDLAGLFKRVKSEKICFVGLRSGLLDLVQHAGGYVVALYPPDTGLEHFFEMGQGVLDNTFVSQYTITEDMHKDIENILKRVRDILN